MIFETGSRARAYHSFAVTCPAHADMTVKRQNRRCKDKITRPAHQGGDRRITIVLEAYVWDSIDSMLDHEGVSLDAFSADVDGTRFHNSMASSARLVILAYFKLLEQINSPPFVDPKLQRMDREGMLRAPAAANPPVPLPLLALKRFAQDEARVE